uniref:Uncharacterized protein n=1 Tax=Ditylenchus dipsaci TaxID=166011 RepID=A0A915CY45_9BILA
MNLPAYLLILWFIAVYVDRISSLATDRNFNVKSVEESQLKRIVSLIELIPKIVKNTTFTTYQPASNNEKGTPRGSLAIVNMPYDPVSSLKNNFDSEIEKNLAKSYSSYISLLEADIYKIYTDEDIKKENLQEYISVKRIVNAKWAIALFRYLLNSYQHLKSPIENLLLQLRPTVQSESLFDRLFNKKKIEPVDPTQEILLKALENFVNHDVLELRNLALKIFKTFLSDVEQSRIKLPPVLFSELNLLETGNIQSESPKIVCKEMKDKTIYNLMCLLVKLMNYVDQGIKVDEANHTVSTALFDVNQVDEYDFYAVHLLKTNIEYVNKEKQKFEESIQLFPCLETLISYRWILDFILYITTNCKLVLKTISHNNSENFIKLQELHTQMRLLDHTINEDEKEIFKEMEYEKRNKRYGFDKNIIHQLDTTEVLELDWFKQH